MERTGHVHDAHPGSLIDRYGAQALLVDNRLWRVGTIDNDQSARIALPGPPYCLSHGNIRMHHEPRSHQPSQAELRHSVADLSRAQRLGRTDPDEGAEDGAEHSGPQ